MWHQSAGCQASCTYSTWLHTSKTVGSASITETRDRLCDWQVALLPWQRDSLGDEFPCRLWGLITTWRPTCTIKMLCHTQQDRDSESCLCRVGYLPVCVFHTQGSGYSQVSSCGSAGPRCGSYCVCARRGWTPAALSSAYAFSPSFGSRCVEDLWFDRRGMEAWPVKTYISKVLLYERFAFLPWEHFSSSH